MNASMSFSFDYDFFDPDRMRDYGHVVLDKIFPEGNESKIAVRIDTCSIEGMIDMCNIIVFDSYVNALDTINSYEYTKNTQVQVYEINKKGYAEMLMKVYDGVCYSRLAQCHFEPYSLADARWLFDTKATIYVAELEVEEK